MSNTNTNAAPEEYYLFRRGLYFRPNAAGYTANESDAGRFTRAQANDFVRGTVGDSEPVTMRHAPPAPAALDRGTLREKFEEDLRSIKDSANEKGAGDPPTGYVELADFAVADACYIHGIDCMANAVSDWLHDLALLPATAPGQHPDERRLDWLEKNEVDLYEKHGDWYICDNDSCYPTVKGLRQAIDAAARAQRLADGGRG